MKAGAVPPFEKKAPQRALRGRWMHALLGSYCTSTGRSQFTPVTRTSASPILTPASISTL